MSDNEETQEDFPTYQFPGRPPPCSQGSNVRKIQYYSIYVYMEGDLS